MPELGELDAYKDINSLLQLGVAYHHGGMLSCSASMSSSASSRNSSSSSSPQRPSPSASTCPHAPSSSRSSDKPNDGDLPGHRPLRTMSFGRWPAVRGGAYMDELGYVIYAPTLSVGGLRTMASSHELREMSHGSDARRALAARRRPLVRVAPFGARLRRGGARRTAPRRRQPPRARRAEAELAAADAAAGGAGAGGGGAALAAASARFAEVKAKLGGEEIGGVKMQIGQKARKALEKELRELKEAHGDAIEAQATADANARAPRTGYPGERRGASQRVGARLRLALRL